MNVGVTAYNIDNLGIKAILKTTGKQTAKAMVKGPDGKEAQKQEPQEKTNAVQQVQKTDEENKK